MQYSKSHLNSALKKYGVGAFELQVIESDIPEPRLDERERYYIQQYDSYYHGFNCTLGGQGVHGYKHTEETKSRISKSVAAGSYRWNTPERAAKIKAAQKGRKFTEEHRQRIREVANRNKRFGADSSFGGRRHTESAKKKMSLSSTKNQIQRISKSDNSVLETYSNQWEAANWVKDNLPVTGRLDSVYHRISEAMYHLNGTKSAYGFYWKPIVKSDNTPESPEGADTDGQ
jgi:group I intron endonuclease